MTNFIYCFDEKLKDELLSKGYQLVSSNNNQYIFINDTKLKFEFADIDKTKYHFNNKMLF
jgi:hypothetical protein